MDIIILIGLFQLFIGIIQAYLTFKQECKIIILVLIKFIKVLF